MKKVRASVPAKVILFGEHFVVYGKRALATAINRRLVVEATPTEKAGYHVKIANIPTFGLELDLTDVTSEVHPYKDYASATKALAYVTSAIQYLEDEYGIGGAGVELEIKSEIPLSAGLGSSAATCVATIAALKDYFGVPGDLEAIRTDAHTVEKAVQGAASPVDTAISTYGGYVFVERNEVKRLPLARLHLIVGSISSIPLSMDIKKYSELGLKTKKLVEKVRIRKEMFEDIFESISNAADALTAQALDALEHDDVVKLGALMDMNHGLLDAIGVVPRQLSELVKLSKALGAFGAKVTGAGSSDEMGGVGSVLVLPRDSADSIKTALDSAGALVMDVQTGERGLRIEV